mmetsp:Transcript_121749/g.191072  ORF Transcript_121749/g.191072 Transcript_121749/m.191072 type:complete len:377 (-) Transcript_121749:42-1172(-)
MDAVFSLLANSMGGVFGGPRKARTTNIIASPHHHNGDRAPLLSNGKESLRKASFPQAADRHIRSSRHEVGPESYAKMDQQRNFSEIYDHDVTAVPAKKFDFEAFGAVPNGWVKSTSRLPQAFLFAGSTCMVIEREEESADGVPTIELRVLVALSEAAVDLQRAKWLCRRPGFNAEAAYLCHLCRSRECKASGSVVLEFDYPRGESLADVLSQEQQLSDAEVRVLVHQLMKLVVFAANKPLRLLGFIDPSMVFLNEQRELMKFVPLGCLLSYSGAKAATYQAVESGADWALAPEVKRAVLTNDRSLEQDMDIAIITDAYAVSVLALRALGQRRVDDKGIEIDIPDLAHDMLKKALHSDPEWRLSAEAALSHPWIAQH